MTQRTERVMKELTPFTLSLPPVFDLKPAYEVAVSATRTLFVYDTIVQMREHDDNGKTMTVSRPGWRTVIKTKRGTFIDSDGGRFNRHSNDGQVFTDPLLLSLYAQALAVEYAKKKKTTVEETDIDD